MSISDKTKLLAKKTTRSKVTKSGIKSEKLSTVKIPVAKKRVTTKNAVVAPKVSVKKKIGKKVVTKVKSVTLPKTKKLKAKNVFTEELVTMPSIPSLRLLEKTEIYKLWYKNHAAKYIGTTAQYCGYLFVVLGTLLASSSYLLDKDLFSLSAAVVCSEDCVEIPDKALPPGSPSVIFSTLPAELTDDLKIELTIENTNNVKVFLISAMSGEQILLEKLNNQSGNQYQYMIPAGKLTASTYTILAEAQTPSAVYKFTGPTFFVPTLVTANESSALASAVTEDLVEEISTTTATTSEFVEEKSDGIEETPAIAITLKEGTDAKYLNIKTGNFLPSSVEVYSKLEFSDESIFLGLATFVQGEWVFSLSALDLPVANHLVYASFIANGAVYQTDGVEYVPQIKEIDQIVNEADLNILLQKVELSMQNASLTLATRSELYSEFSKENIFGTETEEQFASAAAIVMMNEVITEEIDNLNLLLQHYASAVQGENAYLINLADLALTNHYKSIAHTVAVRLEDNSIIPSLTTILALRNQTLKDMVLKSEQLFKSESSNLVARDSDKDGFSDFDEVSLYNTNPSVTDTDSDGVSDAIEIIKDFNPLVSDIKSAATITQNIDEIIFNDIVTVTSVEPVIVKGVETNDEEVVFALVQGKSLPNTFVTIISYTSGTLGLIRTNNVGDFIYTLEKELADGDQEIVSVLTDNEGNIVASSKPYHFTSKGNVFVAATASAQKPTLIAYSENKQSLAQNIIAAMGVVAFGFILLILAEAVRFRKTIDGQEGEIIVA